MTGPNKSFGAQLKAGAQWALRRCGKSEELKIQVYDDEGDPQRAKKTALKVVSNPAIVSVIGHATSQTTREAQKFYSIYDMPLFVPIATYTGLTQARGNEKVTNVARLVPSNRAQAELIASLVTWEKHRSVTRDNFSVFLYHEPGDYGEDLSTLIKQEVREKGINVLRDEPLTFREDGTIDVRPAVQDSRLAGIGAFIFAGYHYQASVLVTELAPSLPTDVPIILTDGAKDSELFKDLGWSPNRLYVTFVAPEWPEEGDLAELLSWYRTHVAENRDAEAGYLPLAADAATILCDLFTSDLDPTPHRFRRQILRRLGEPDREFEALTRAYGFGANGEAVGQKAYLFEILRPQGKAGAFREATMPLP